MIQRVVVVVLCLLAGCSVRKQSTNERTALHASEQVVANREKQLRQHEQVTTSGIQLAYASGTAEIVPLGTFRLSADSGYMGRAERVVIHRESRGLSITESNAVASTVDSSAARAATREYTAVQRDTLIKQQEADVSPPLKIPWWMWLGVAGGVLYLTWRFLVK